MKISITPRYNLKTEKEYCCVPAVLQMIQERRGLKSTSQDEIGYQLGLTVPKEKVHLFSKVRTGRMPKTGWGTQTSKKQYSINNYFITNNLPLKLTFYNIEAIDNVSDFIIQNIMNDNDIIIRYNSQLLWGNGDTDHVSLIQEIENKELAIVDPAIGVPKIRKIRLSQLIHVLKSYDASNQCSFWIVSRIACKTLGVIFNP
jgi:hypothetical protein